ncbi:hypothetical protein MUK42_02548 [Musa troglodytarum]|uniref:RRM domain-containing protein n=1 Tax=Musa troglodytarum TaxID=320322 RepID=A0A9E7JEK7_9LILI|nr:hypothetical protein MUK42_02548 [Musa troglodytarum]
MAAVAAAAATTDAAASSLLKLSPFRFPNTLLSSSSLRLLSFHHFASVPLSVSHCHHPLSPLTPLPSFPRAKKALAVDGAEENAAVTTVVDEKLEDGADDGVPEEVKAPVRRPCELYVCNLPRSCDISKLLDLFKPYGTVHSVEVVALNFVYWFPSRFLPILSSISFCCLRLFFTDFYNSLFFLLWNHTVFQYALIGSHLKYELFQVSRDAETSLSRGCGYVTMSSIQEAKAAMAALDGSDLGGRELRVKFSADLSSRRKNMEALNTTPKKNMVFESPHKVYVGNLAWSVRPEDLREYFSQFGNIVSARVLYDRKGGRNRVYGFLSFTSSDELRAALETSGTEFNGRTLVVREVINREEI